MRWIQHGEFLSRDVFLSPLLHMSSRVDSHWTGLHFLPSNGVHSVIVFLAIATRREAVYRLVPDEQPLIEEAIKELVG